MEYKDEATLKRLLLLDYFRGTDSTGVAAIRKDNNHKIAKIASHPIDLFDSKSYEALNHAYQTKAFIGHNRAATKGKVNGLNAHPYQYGHIIGAHNGTLETSSWRALNEVLDYETDVDSMAIFACIEKIGIAETVKLLRGAWSLVWADLEQGTLNFLRNDQRPMWLAQTADHKKLIWASEWPMIQAACEMSPKADDYKMHFVGQYCYFYTEVDHLYSFDLETIDTESFGIIKGPKMEGLPPLPVVSYQGGAHGGGSPFTARNGNTGSTTRTTTTSRGTESRVPAQMTIVTGAEKPFANFLSQEEFNEMTRGTCCYCQEPIQFIDEGLVVFEGINEVLCGDCSGHSTSRYMATPKTYNEYLQNGKVN